MINIETCFLLHILFISKQVAEIRHFLQETLNKYKISFLVFLKMSKIYSIFVVTELSQCELTLKKKYIENENIFKNKNMQIKNLLLR